MRLFKRLMFVPVTAVMLVMGSLGATSQAYAAEETPEYRMRVSPSSLQVDELKPGETKEVTFKVQNTGQKDIGYSLDIAPYSVSGENYEHNFESSAYSDIADWITFSQDSGVVKPNEEDVVTATIKVLRDVPAGGQYAAIMVYMNDNLDDEKPEGTAITAEKRIALVLYASVAGNTRKEGSVVENKVPSFMFAPPISATSIVENKGNVHAEATYIFQVYPLFGGDEVYSNESDPETRIIMPDTRRLNTITWDGAPKLGIFKVKQTVKFLGETSVTEKMLFICPIWFLLIVLAVIFLAIFGIVMRVRGGRKD